MDESGTESERVGRYRVVAHHDREGARLRLHLDASLLLRLAPDPERPGRSRLEIAGVVDHAANEAARGAASAAAPATPEPVADGMANEARSAKPRRWRVGVCVLLGASGVAAALAASWRFFATHEAPRRSEAPALVHEGPRPSEARAAPPPAEPSRSAGNGDARSAAPLRPSPSAPKPAPAVIRLQPSASAAPPPNPPPTPRAQPSTAALSAPRAQPSTAALSAPRAQPSTAALSAPRLVGPSPLQERVAPPAPHVAVPPAARDGVAPSSARPAAPSGLELFDDTK